MHRKEKETKTSWVCPPPPKGKGPWVQMDIAKRWKIWQVMFTKVSKCEFLKEKMRFTYPNQEIFVHELFCTRRHAPPLTPWHPPHNAHLSSTLARLRAFRQLTTPLTQAAHQDLGPQCGVGHARTRQGHNAWSISTGLENLTSAAQMNRELLTWLEALAYETKEFIDDDEIEKKELKAMHLRIQEHEADFLWLQGRTASWRRSCVST